MTTTIEERINAVGITMEGTFPLLSEKEKDQYQQAILDLLETLEQIKKLADDTKNMPEIIDGKYQDWDSTKDPQFAPEIEAQIKKREAQNDNSIYNPIWFARDFRSGARFAVQLIQSKLKSLL